jgi:flagellar protein FliS
MDAKLGTYKTIDTLGKTPLELIIKVYDGAIQAFRDARKSYEAEEFTQGHEEIEKARRFLVHLYTTLDMEKGGQVAEQLSKLYSYMISQVDVARAAKDLGRIDDNITILENLRASWQALSEQAAAGGPTVEPTTEPAEVGDAGFSLSG